MKLELDVCAGKRKQHTRALKAKITVTFTVYCKAIFNQYFMHKGIGNKQMV